MKQGAVLVDVRDKCDYGMDHISGAINIPYTDIHAAAINCLNDKDAPIIVYCSTGKRSLQAKRSLEYLGFKNVYYLQLAL